MAEFKKAEKRRAWLKIALTGPSGSGKTYSALLMARGMGQRVALIDTENSSASLYAGEFQFDTLDLDPPYEVSKYVEAIKKAVEGKYDVLIIDSISHAWAGAGGLLDKKEMLDSRGGKQNKFTNWGSITKEHELFKSWLLAADIHVIATMRSKQEYVQTEDKKVIKLGMAPVQREGIEYEFTAVFDIGMNHMAVASKDRTGVFDQKMFVPTEDTGRQLIGWLNAGSVGDLPSHTPAPKTPLITMAPMQTAPTQTKASQAQLNELTSVMNKAGWTVDEVVIESQRLFKKNPPFLDQDQFTALFASIETKPKQKQPLPKPGEPYPLLTEKQIGRLWAIAREKKWEEDDVHGLIQVLFKKESVKDLFPKEYETLCNYLEHNKPLGAE